jgi:adenosylmethionine-8-amino-7-oxononanoate aminotransferase
LKIQRAEGAYFFTEDGSPILDAAGGAIVVNVGQGRPEVAEAVARELRRVSYVVPPFATDSRLRLTERLLERWLPEDLTRVLYTSGGSESVDAALRLARQHHVAAGRPERWKVIARDVSYHGATLSTLAVGGHTARREVMGPLLVQSPKTPACYCLRCPLGKTYPSCGVGCVDEIERVIRDEGPETVAAVIAEPIVGSSGGALVPPEEYWTRLAEICRRHGVLLIADEVMTGFGRTGKRFAIEHFGVTPDILVGGKGLAGGYAPTHPWVESSPRTPWSSRWSRPGTKSCSTRSARTPRPAPLPTPCSRSWSARISCTAQPRPARRCANGSRSSRRTRTSPRSGGAVSCRQSSWCATARRSSPFRGRRG